MASGKPDLQHQQATADILSRSSTSPIYVSEVEVNGGEDFSNDFFKKLLSPVLTTSDYTVESLLKKTKETESKILKTGVFQDVNIRVEENQLEFPKSVRNYMNETPVQAKIIYDLKSSILKKFDSFLTVNNDNLNINLNYLNNNFNTDSEFLQAGVSYNPYVPNLIANIKLSTPLNDNPSIRTFINFINLNLQSNFQNCKNHTNGGVIGLQSLNSYKGFITTSTVGISILQRGLINLNDGISDSIRKDIGKANKVSLIHTSSLTSLKQLNNFPTSGSLINLENEVGNSSDLLKNNFKFFKSTLTSTSYKSFYDDTITVNFETGFGLLFPLDYDLNKTSNLHVNDKFYLGGISNFKGYELNSIGPKDGNEYTGGESYVKMGGSVYFKLPRFLLPNAEKDSPIRLYATANIGDVFNKPSGLTKFAKNCLNSNFSAHALNLGVGIKYFNPRANFDISYVIVNPRSTDAARSGLQFSVAIGGSNN